MRFTDRAPRRLRPEAGPIGFGKTADRSSASNLAIDDRAIINLRVSLVHTLTHAPGRPQELKALALV
ncbi:MAG: hypothetical protein AB7F35_00295 [Acetobacteraceae bacterium]